MREVIEILKRRIYAIAHAGVFIKINGVESMLTEIKGIEEASLEIEALLPKPISVKDRLPEKSGHYVTVCLTPEGDLRVFKDYYKSETKEFMNFHTVKYWMPESELLKLLPKGE